MKVPMDVFRRKLVGFIRDHLVPQMGSNSDRFLVSFVVAYKEPDIDEMLAFLGSATEVDIDRIDGALRSAFSATTDGKYRYRNKALEDNLVFSLSDWEMFKAQIGG